MKIGEFADKNKISKDTVRYYMDLGLVIPEKQGGQYHFDHKSQSSLEEILTLKDMGFTLGEIKTIFMFRLLGNLTHYQQDEYYRTLFENKHEKILREIDNLTAIRDKLKEKINSLSLYESKKIHNIGIDIFALKLLKCLKCGGQLHIQNGSIEENQVLDGTLKCSCGESYSIEDGVLIVDEPCYESEFKFDYDYVAEYINLTDYSYLDNVYKGLDWVKKKIDFSDLKDKVVLELGSGVGFALRSIYTELSEDCLYIAVDHDIARHRFLKNMLERAQVKRNIIFICADFTRIPIREKSADLVLDYSGSSNYSFEHSEFLLKVTDKYVKEDAYLMGAYILFKNFGSNSLIEDRLKSNFVLQNVKSEIKSLGYECIDDRSSDYVENGGKYEDYFIHGEKVYNYVFYGRRM